MLLKIVLLFNVLTFIVMGYDKKQAKGRGRRIPEFTLMTMAVFMGAGGIFAGMYFFRHKTKQGLFLYGIPLLFSFNILGLYYLLNLVSK